MTRWLGKRLGVALGGGGARGFCHIGVFKVLEEEGITIDVIAGTSAGALIGGAYASGCSWQEIHRRVDGYIRSPEFRASTLREMGVAMGPAERRFWRRALNSVRQKYLLLNALRKPAVLPVEDFEALIAYFIPDIDIGETKIPFRAVATDLITGTRVVMSEGSLRRAVLASCAVPGAVDPIRVGDWLLADGGIASLVPVMTAREAGADAVIAVVVSAQREIPGEFRTARDIVSRAGDITSDLLEAAELRQADVIIRPRTGDLHWSDFSRAKTLVEEGEAAARLALGEIREALPVYKKVLRVFRRPAPRPAAAESARADRELPQAR